MLALGNRLRSRRSTGQLSALLVLGALMVAGTVPAQAVYHGSDDENQLYVSELVAAKPDGQKQPLDLFADITDENGKLVEGAKVMARATDFETFVDAPLTEIGNGRYMTCAFGYFNGSGKGALRIHVRADKSGYTPGQGDGSNTVGRLCTVPPGSDTASTQ